MGLAIRIHDVTCPNNFLLSYKIGGKTAVGNYTSYNVGANVGNFYNSSNVRNYNSDPILLTGTTLDNLITEDETVLNRVWIKLQYTGVTGNVEYIIENIEIHQREYYSNCIDCCVIDGDVIVYTGCTMVGSAVTVLGPTPTPTVSPTATTVQPTPTATVVPPTPTPTATVVPPTPTATVVPPTPTPTLGEINASAFGGMEPCIGGTINDYMGCSVSLSNPVTVDTNFMVDVFFVYPGNTCNYTNIYLNNVQSFSVTVLAGEMSGQVNACSNGVYFSGGADVCCTQITGHNNTVDNIIITSQC